MIEFPLRPREDLNSGWQFVRGKAGRSWLSGGRQDGEPVSLPHSWNLDDTYQFGRKSYRGFGAYRREIRIRTAATDGTWYLCAGGFYGIGDVWLDGRRLDRIDGQYLGFDIPLPPTLGRGPHVVAIRLDNRFHRNVLPGRDDPDFLLYGGLAGGVWLEQRPWPCLDIRSTVIACTPNPDGSEKVGARTFVSNPHGAAADARINWTITDPEGTPIARTEPIRATGSTRGVATVAEPRCWSPEHPDLYWAEGRLENDSGVIDVIRVRFGITHAEFRPREGFFLDGRRTELHGVNRHESIPGLGNALPLEIHRADAQLLKRYGCNIVRLSHYPQHPTFLDACDELGIMVYGELASWKSVRSSRGWRRAAKNQFRDLITRDRHHPSVILWGMGNESRSRKAYLELRDLAHELDSARPVTYAENHLYRARRHKIIGIPDVWSTNYELDVLDEARDSSRLEVVFLSECCNHPASIKGDWTEELEQVRVIERDWEVMTGIEGLAGHTVWSFADYATEHRDRYRRQNGLFDAWRRPKMAAELFRARYSDEPFISLFLVQASLGTPASPYRTEVPSHLGRGSALRLHLFSNCEGLRVLQGGTLLASVESVPHTIIPVDLEQGEIVAEGYASGRTVTGILTPPGEPRAIELLYSDGRPSAGPIQTLDLRVMDSDGVTVPSWNGHVHVSGSGGATVLSYTAAGEVLVTRGEGRVHVRTTPEALAPEVAACADGLESGKFTLGAAG